MIDQEIDSQARLLKKCARIGRPGSRQAAGGQAGRHKPYALVTADGLTQNEAVRGSTPPI
jgi:hypothetical protein